MCGFGAIKPDSFLCTETNFQRTSHGLENSSAYDFYTNKRLSIPVTLTDHPSGS